MSTVWSACLKFKLYITIAFVVFIGIQPYAAQATVPTWDVGLSGAIPLVILEVPLANNLAASLLSTPGYHHKKEFHLNGIGLSDLYALAIPSWDQIAYFLAHELLREIKQEVLTWIQSGFEGKPQFLEDPERFFTQIADNATGIFLEDLGDAIADDPNFFCDPNLLFQFQIDYGQVRRKDYFDRSSCTLSRSINTVEDFYEDFQNGGWESFIRIRESRNNRMGAYLLAFDEAQERRYKADSVFRQSAQSGGGYLPTMKCADGEDSGIGCRKFIIRSPAKAIGDRVAATIGTDYDEIMSADEVSEIISALVNLGIQQAVKQLGN